MKPNLYQLAVHPVIWDAIKAAIENKFPNLKVERFIDSDEEKEDGIVNYMVVPK